MCCNYFQFYNFVQRWTHSNLLIFIKNVYNLLHIKKKKKNLTGHYDNDFCKQLICNGVNQCTCVQNSDHKQHERALPLSIYWVDTNECHLHIKINKMTKSIETHSSNCCNLVGNLLHRTHALQTNDVKLNE